ncbi:MAG: transglutaminase-like domain-containing protein [Clostridium sp.]|nr:transglutaminase-like domain-containing protein [Clostridium sp.]
MKINKKLIVIIGFVSGVLQVGILLLALMIPSVIINSTPLNYDLCVDVVSQMFDYVQNNSVPSDYLKKIVIYNGTTVGHGVKSNEEIDSKAVQLTKDAHSDRERAKIIYTWVGSNIKYDDNKAEIILSEKTDSNDYPESGAICAYDTRSGICFDKACLYVAMARAVGLKVKLISGKAFDGKQYVGHAWNQVYLNDENRWIDVDPTFYDAGNYFDSNLFSEHKASTVAGEW